MLSLFNSVSLQHLSVWKRCTVMLLDNSWSKIIRPVLGLCTCCWFSVLLKASAWCRTEILAMSRLPALPASDLFQTTHGGYSCSSVLTRAKSGSCQHARGPTSTPVGEAGVSISKEDWDREGHVGSPHIFPSMVNCLWVKPIIIHGCAS